jgi:acyl-CoA thioester hydrolase
MSKKYTRTITVTEEHIDDYKHVNNLVYLQWCLDVAQGDWEENATQKMRTNYVWYVLNHTINYSASAFLGDTLEIHTWVESAEGVKSTRKYEITRPKDEKVLVEASTLWCLLDAKTVRATEVTAEIRTLFSI